MARGARQREQVRRSNMVRIRATKELIARHLDEYRELYAAEAAKLGVSARPDVGAKRKTAEEAIEEVKRSGLLNGVEISLEGIRELPDFPEPPILREQRMTRDEILETKVEGAVPRPPWEDAND